MTNEPIVLSTAPHEDPAMDYAFLRAEGIRHLERMAGKIWTDFNTHDPGITILEQVCYALTDLANRINYAMPDLLTGPEGNPYRSLFTPAQILPSHPVTLLDLRKLAINVAGVKNAWVEKVTSQNIPLFYNPNDKLLSFEGDPLTYDPIYLKGLYQVKIELSDVLNFDGTAEQREAVRRKVATDLHAYRGLGEDFETIERLIPEDIEIHARIEVEAVDDAEGVLLKIYQKMSEYVSPPVKFYSLAELLEAGQRIDEIFDGPLLDHGFIDNQQLKQAQRRTVLRTSDLIQEIMDVPGVRAVRSIALSKGGTKENWSLDLKENQAPRFNPTRSVITLERNRLPASIDQARVVESYYKHMREQDIVRKQSQAEMDLQPPAGQERQIDQYFSIQHQFPATYGIGEMGLPDSATPQRKAQAKQLQAYLMFFDQILANYFSQLSHARELYAFSGDALQSYYSQMITDDTLGLEGIRIDEAAHAERLKQITESPEQTTSEQTNLRRRNRFLNHLLARFAEQFTDYSLVLYGAMPAEGKPAAEKLAKDKQDFLANYPQLSAGRGTGVDYLKPAGPHNLSGTEQRIRSKLGLDGADEQLYVVEHILLRPMAEDLQQLIPILADPNSSDPYSLQVSFVLSEWAHRFRDPGFKAFVGRVIREETPAHLSVTIHWLNEAEMTVFKDAYDEWLQQRRQYLMDELGL